MTSRHRYSSPQEHAGWITMQCKALGLPLPEFEAHFHPTRKWRFDAAWAAQRLALEVDGGAFSGGRHVRGAGVRNDCIKLSEAAVLGWRVIRCLPEHVKSGQAIDWVRRALERSQGYADSHS